MGYTYYTSYSTFSRFNDSTIRTEPALVPEVPIVTTPSATAIAAAAAIVPAATRGSKKKGKVP